MLALILGVSAFAYDTPKGPSWIKDQVMYEINPASFTAEGTYSSIAVRMPYLRDLGVTGIWMMPVTRMVDTVTPKQARHWLYGIREPEQLETRFGSEEDFKNMVQSAHDNGIRIYLDILPHGVRSESSLLTRHPDFFLRDANGHPIGTWWACDYNWKNPEFVKWWIQTQKDWVLKYNVDGFRVDMDPFSGGYVPYERLRAECEAAGHPIVIWSECPNARRNAYDFEQISVVARQFDRKSLVDIVRWGTILSDQGSDKYYTFTLSNHDLVAFSGYNMAERAYFAFFSPFIPLFYQSEELAGGAGAWEILDWSKMTEADKIKHDKFQKMIAIRKENADLVCDFPEDHRTASIVKVPTVGSTLESYARYDGRGKALVVSCINGDNPDDTLYLNIPLKAMNMAGYDSYKVTNLWTGTISMHKASDLKKLTVRCNPGWTNEYSREDPCVIKIEGVGGKPKIPTSIRLNTEGIEIQAGDRTLPSYTLYDQNGEPIEGANVIVVTDDPSIANVKQDGYLYAEKPGAANLRAVFAGVETQVPVVVKRNPTVDGAKQVCLDLTPYFNAVGFSSDTNTTVGNLNGKNSMPVENVPAETTINDVKYKFGPRTDGTKSIIVCKGQTIGLPDAKLAYLSFVAVSASNPIFYDIAVKYQDGSESAFSFPMSNWFSPSKYDTLGLFSEYANTWPSNRWGGGPETSKYLGNRFYYPLSCPVRTIYLDPTKKVQSLTLPDAQALKIFAVTVGDVSNQ